MSYIFRDPAVRNPSSSSSATTHGNPVTAAPCRCFWRAHASTSTSTSAVSLSRGGGGGGEVVLVELGLPLVLPEHLRGTEGPSAKLHTNDAHTYTDDMTSTHNTARGQQRGTYIHSLTLKFGPKESKISQQGDMTYRQQRQQAARHGTALARKEKRKVSPAR